MRRAFSLLLLAACEISPPPSSPELPPSIDGGVDANPQDSGAIRETGCTVGAPDDPLTVATSRGLVRGTEEGRTVRYAGIPFAVPLIGSLRFRPPEEPACWDDVFAANEFGDVCPQLDPVSGDLAGDEDCLNLNVWTPAGAPRSRANLPVLFWIHGGANILGSSAMQLLGVPFYDGRYLAESQNVVVISANYRLGALGFMVHSSLAAESEHGVSGNYAILDLIAALEWVKENAAAFGGDPSRVLVFGESAGAFNTCALLGSPLAAGLFSSALMQSGACRQPEASWVEAIGAPALETLGCDGAADVAACLRAKSPEELVRLFEIDLLTAAAMPFQIDPNHPNALPFGASVDGYVIPMATIEAMAAGTHNDVPFVIGSNQHESELFVPPTTLMTCSEYEENLGTMFPAFAADVLAQYPCGDYPTARMAFADVQTDLFFTCPTREAAAAASAGGTSAVHRYYFTHGRVLGPLAILRAAHSMEIPFVFGSVGKNGDLATPDELRLSERMQDYWANFAADGDPNPIGATDWQRYDPARDNAIVLDEEIGEIEQIKRAQCDFWSSVLAY